MATYPHPARRPCAEQKLNKRTAITEIATAPSGQGGSRRSGQMPEVERSPHQSGEDEQCGERCAESRSADVGSVRRGGRTMNQPNAPWLAPRSAAPPAASHSPWEWHAAPQTTARQCERNPDQPRQQAVEPLPEEIVLKAARYIPPAR